MTPLGLPNADLDTARPLGARFAAQGAWTYRDAARLVWGLPYGEPRGSGIDAVLREGRGTAGTKHALLAALAEEVGLPVELRLGLYLLDAQNTPRARATLRTHGLDAVPETWVVLASGGKHVDLTWPGRRAPVPTFLDETTIRPDQIGAHAQGWHRDRLGAWAEARDLDPDAVWAAHEAVVAALSR